jgi:DUF4097 and DUF4098 domain-containing protein YvlB
MKRRWSGLVLAGWLGAALPAAAQTPRVEADELRRDVERVVEHAASITADSVERSLRSLDVTIARDLARVERLPRIAEARVRNSQNRNRNRNERTDRSSRTIALGPNGVVELRNVSGDITVTVGGGRDVVIETIKESRAGSDADADLGLKEVQVTVDHRGERVVVDTTYPRRRTPYQVSTSYNVTAPAGTRVNARSVSGSVNVRGISGDLTVETVSGSIRIDNAARVSQAQSVSGDVIITDLNTDGTVASGTVSGTITLTRVKARRVTAENVSGNIRAENVTCDGVLMKSLSGTVEFHGPLSRNGRYELQSHSGTVRVGVTGNVGFELQARSFSGRIRPEGLSLQSITMNRGALNATVGDASAVVIAGTFSGDVIVGRK